MYCEYGCSDDDDEHRRPADVRHVYPTRRLAVISIFASPAAAAAAPASYTRSTCRWAFIWCDWLSVAPPAGWPAASESRGHKNSSGGAQVDLLTKKNIIISSKHQMSAGMRFWFQFHPIPAWQFLSPVSDLRFHSGVRIFESNSRSV